VACCLHSSKEMLMKKTSVIIMETKYVYSVYYAYCLYLGQKDFIIHGVLLHATNTNFAVQWYNDCEWWIEKDVEWSCNGLF
jgi:hypothetical protein